MTDLPAECRKHSDELPLPYEVKVTLLDAAARIEQLEAALRYYACKCKNPHTGCAVEFERSGNARCGWEARAALGDKP